MELSEGKLFTIEALNRIEGFEWPDGANWARLYSAIDDKIIHFFSGDEWIKSINYSIDNPNCLGVDDAVTRAEFESVDGWVRNDGKSIPDVNVKSIIDVIFRSGHKTWFAVGYVDFSHTNNEGDVMKWRYRKKQKQVNQPNQQPIATIETLISQHKAARKSTLEAIRLLEQAEAFEHTLLLSIEAWAESNGFDIRVLDEVKK